MAGRRILHHLPQREAVLERMLRWAKPGGVVFVHGPDFTPTLTVEPDDQRRF
jgi:2-polyprenyl-3-methyl-5-hydroxy-6-metoxy-1,4-benzoquinol methylase